MKRAWLACLFTLSLPAWAGLPVLDFRNLPNPADDLQAALHLAYETWSPPLADANHLAAQARITPDDFQVAVFLSSKSGWSLSALWDLRSRGMEWSDVARRCRVPWDAIVVRPARDYGPPYGKAWGYWKKHGGKRGFRLTDGEFVDMVRVHTLARATGLSEDQVVASMHGGTAYQKWAGEIYRQKHGRGHGHGEAEGEDGHGRGHEGREEHGHGEGHAEDHGHGRGRGGRS